MVHTYPCQIFVYLLFRTTIKIMSTRTFLFQERDAMLNPIISWFIWATLTPYCYTFQLKYVKDQKATF